MNMKKMSGKLTLNKETLRSLDDNKLSNVNGGAPTGQCSARTACCTTLMWGDCGDILK